MLRTTMMLIGCLAPAALVGQSPGSVAPSRSSADSLPSWISADPGARVISLELRTTNPGSGGAQLNGFDHGAMQVVVPLGWTVQWNWENADSAQPHSLVVMEEREKLPTEAGRPAFTNAMTRAASTGMRPGQRDVTTFEADQAGWYWLLCGVPGHALKGEWIGLKVDREASGPSVVRKP